MTAPTVAERPSLDYLRGRADGIGAHEPGCGCHDLVPLLMDRLERLVAPVADVDIDDLTETERQVARLLLGWTSYADLARHRGVSLNTIRTHIKAVYRKLGVSSRSELRRHLRGTEAL